MKEKVGAKLSGHGFILDVSTLEFDLGLGREKREKISFPPSSSSSTLPFPRHPSHPLKESMRSEEGCRSAIKKVSMRASTPGEIDQCQGFM